MNYFVHKMSENSEKYYLRAQRDSFRWLVLSEQHLKNNDIQLKM